MSRGDRVPAKTLPEGVYEHLVTEELARDLEGLGAIARVIEPLDHADAHTAFARHIGGVVARALSGVPAERAYELVGKMLDHLAGLVGAELAELILDQRIQPPPSRLLALHRGAVPERPTSPLATSTLLTRKRLDPTLGHELAREIATADEVDAIIAFVTVGGVRAIHDALHDFARRAAPKLRLLTTTFTGTTEVAALDTFARLPGAQVRVSYDTRRTRLHAKAWLFRRNTGLTTAYIGSANLTSTALGTGQEWMVKVCAADLPHVIEQFAGTFDTLWNEPEFVAYSPDDPAQRARLQAALSAETSSSPDAFLVTLHALPFQQIILDKLSAERVIHNRRRNLVVAATGTGKTVIAALDYVRQFTSTGVAPRLLFLAHRYELLDQARKTFRHAMQDPSFGELLVGDRKLLERERDRPHDAVVEVRLVAEAERRVPRLELLCALEKADDIAVLGVCRHPVPGLRREGWRAGFDDRVKPLGHRAFACRHLGDLREHVTLPLRCAPARLQLADVLLHRGAFLGR